MEEKEILSVKEMGQSKKFQYSPKTGYKPIEKNDKLQSIVNPSPILKEKIKETGYKSIDNLIVKKGVIGSMELIKPKKKSRKKRML